jgi:hypothetical protein
VTKEGCPLRVDQQRPPVGRYRTRATNASKLPIGGSGATRGTCMHAQQRRVEHSPLLPNPLILTACSPVALYCSVDTSGGYLSAEQGYRFRTDRKVITLKTSQWYLTRASGCKALTACRQSNLFHVVEGPRNLLPHLAAAVGFYRCDGMHIMHMRCCHATSKADYQAEMVTRRKDNRGRVRRAQYLRLHQPNTATNLLTF